MKKLTALPTWLLTVFIIRFFSLPTHHAWADRKFSLTDWHAGQTPLCKQFDLLFWVMLPCFVFALVRILFF